MSQEATVLKAQLRDRVGKGAARELRRNSMVPAVIYGDKKDPLAIALPYKELAMALHGGGFMTTIANIDVDGTKHSVLPRDYQLDPVRDFIEHVDFLRVGKNTKVTVATDYLEIDMTGLDIGDGVHISAVKLPEGVTPAITDRDFTIATVAAPAALTAEEDAGETEDTDVETEVIGEESEDGEGEEGSGEGDAKEE